MRGKFKTQPLQGFYLKHPEQVWGVVCIGKEKGEKEFKGKWNLKSKELGQFLEAITFFYIINSIYDYILYKKILL